MILNDHMTAKTRVEMILQWANTLLEVASHIVERLVPWLIVFSAISCTGAFIYTKAYQYALYVVAVGLGVYIITKLARSIKKC